VTLSGSSGDEAVDGEERRRVGAARAAVAVAVRAFAVVAIFWVRLRIMVEVSSL